MTRVHVLAVILLGSSGAGYALEKLHRVRSEPMPLRIPLDRFPMEIFGPGWKGQDRPMESGVLQIANVDSYIQRDYTDGKRTIWFYVGFVEGWNPRGVHYPEACFPGSGWEMQKKEVVPIPLQGRSAPLFNEYIWTQGIGQRQYTLSTFYFNGKFDPEQSDLQWARLTGVHYFAIINISGPPVGSTDSNEDSRGLYFGLLRKALPKLLEHLPN